MLLMCNIDELVGYELLIRWLFDTSRLVPNTCKCSKLCI